MIEVNLLPKEKRPKKTIPWGEIFNLKLAVLSLGSVVLLHLLLSTLTAINTERLKMLQKKWQDLAGQRTQISQLKDEALAIDRKIPLIEGLISNRVNWSQKLNRISDLLISGLWLREIDLEVKKQGKTGSQDEYLVIQGSAATKNKDEPALIGRFMQGLKDDVSFSADFDEIELGPIKNRQIAQTEIMDFILICRFKPDKVQALLK